MRTCGPQRKNLCVRLPCLWVEALPHDLRRRRAMAFVALGIALGSHAGGPLPAVASCRQHKLQAPLCQECAKSQAPPNCRSLSM